MLKPNLLFILLLVLSNYSFSQTNCNESLPAVTIDFSSSKIEYGAGIDELKKGDFFIVVVEDVNLNQWNIKFDDSVVLLDSTALKTPLFTDLTGGSIASLSEKLITAISANVSKEKAIDDFSGTILSTLSETEPTGAIDKNAEEFNPVLELQARLGHIKSAYIDDGLHQIKIDTDQLAFDAEKYRLSRFLDQENILTYEVLTKEEFLSVVAEIRANILSSLEGIRKESGGYYTYRETILPDIQKIKKMSELDSLILESYTKITTALIGALENNSKSGLKALESILVLNTTTTYCSLPLQYTGDPRKIKLEFVPRDKKLMLQTKATSFYVPLPESNYWSVGLSFVGSNLSDNRFSTLTEMGADSTTEVAILEEEADQAEISLAVLMRVGKKWIKRPNIGHHFTFGSGVSLTQKVRPRFLLGGGFSFGERHNLVFDLGLILGYVERKSSIIDLDQTYSVVPEQVTVSRLKPGFFLAIGYAFN